MAKAQFMMMYTHTKFKILGVLILALGAAFYLNLLPFQLPFDMTATLFSLFGLGITIPLLMIIIGLVILVIGFVYPY